MKISVDDKELFSLSDTQKKVIMNDIHEDVFFVDMCRRLQNILISKYDNCFERLKKEWDQKLASRVDSLPTNQEAYAKLVLSQPDYMSRKARDEKQEKEEQEKKDAEG